MKPSRKHKDLPLSRKFEIVRFVEMHPSMKQKEICDHFGIPQSTPSKLLSNKEAIKTNYFSGETKVETKRQCHPKFENLDKALLTWFRKVRALNACVNGPIFFLPPNTTLVSQPMDAGIIKNLKVHYRNLLLLKKIMELKFFKNIDFY